MRTSNATSRRSLKKSKHPTASRSIVVRLDEESKAQLVQAALLRQISISDYVRQITVAQARREVEAARAQVIALAPHEQLAFWDALNKTPRLTAAQKRLGKLMRGGS
jgi:uncharacterized protein (DUF1778 family)